MTPRNWLSTEVIPRLATVADQHVVGYYDFAPAKSVSPSLPWSFVIALLVREVWLHWQNIVGPWMSVVSAVGAKVCVWLFGVALPLAQVSGPVGSVH